MKVIRDWKRAQLRRSSVAIGVFDGVHLGHRAILAAAADRARRDGLKVVVLTMDPHPSQILHPDSPTPLLYSLEHRLQLLKDMGVSTTVVLKFDRPLMRMSAEAFVEGILIRRLGALAVAVGTNFRFGRGARGDADFLAAAGRTAGFKVSAVHPLKSAGQAISSSRIRKAVTAGRLDAASKLLGRPYGLSGTVVRGDGKGRELGFPTINLLLDHELLPPSGVYAVRAASGGKSYPGVLHLGPRPTFGSADLRAECHLLKTPGTDLYGRRFELTPVRRLRGVRRFADPAALARQIGRDVRSARLALQSSSRKVY